eukprot:m.419238 g.419238  ORF g.419238 m.419238 type:complete len:820 (+) comp21302_c0_seq10:349-2808(+)
MSTTVFLARFSVSIFVIVVSSSSQRVSATAYASDALCAALGWEPPFDDDIVCGSATMHDQCYNSASGVSYNQTSAEDICISAGGRLCSAVEVSENVISQSSCAIESDMIWTSSECNHTGEEDGFLVVQGGNISADAELTDIASCYLPTQLFYVACCADTIENDITVVDYTHSVVTGQTIDVTVRVSTSSAVRSLLARFKLGPDTYARANIDLEGGLRDEEVTFSLNVTYDAIPAVGYKVFMFLGPDKSYDNNVFFISTDENITVLASSSTTTATSSTATTQTTVIRDHLDVVGYNRTVATGGVLSFSVLISVSSVGAVPGFHLRVSLKSGQFTLSQGRIAVAAGWSNHTLHTGFNIGSVPIGTGYKLFFYLTPDTYANNVYFTGTPDDISVVASTTSTTESTSTAQNLTSTAATSEATPTETPASTAPATTAATTTNTSQQSTASLSTSVLATQSHSETATARLSSHAPVSSTATTPATSTQTMVRTVTDTPLTATSSAGADTENGPRIHEGFPDQQASAATYGSAPLLIAAIVLLALVLLCLLVVVVLRSRRTPRESPADDVPADECDADRPGTYNPLYHDGHTATDMLAQLAATARFDPSRTSASSLQWELEASEAELEPSNMAHDGMHKKGPRKHADGGGGGDRAAKVKRAEAGFPASPPVAPASPAYERYEGEAGRRRSLLAPLNGGERRAGHKGSALPTRRPLALSPPPPESGPNKQCSPPPSYANSNPNSPMHPIPGTAAGGTGTRRCSSQLSDIYTAEHGHVRLGYLTMVGEEEEDCSPAGEDRVPSDGDNKENPQRPTLDDEAPPYPKCKP